MTRRPPVFVVSGSRFPVRSLSFCRFSLYIPRSYSTPVELTWAHQRARVNAAFPVTLAGRLPQCTLTELCHSSGGCELPCGLYSSLSTLHSSCFTILHALSAIGKFVGNAVPSAIFYGLANWSARLGSDFWLGVITTGLSPDKKRHALHGAQRPSAPDRWRKRASGAGLELNVGILPFQR